jgi:hypothetical protein
MATSKDSTDDYVSKYTPLSNQVFIGMPGIEGPSRRTQKPRNPDDSKKPPSSDGSSIGSSAGSSSGSGRGSKSNTRSSTLKLMATFQNNSASSTQPASSASTKRLGGSWSVNLAGKEPLTSSIGLSVINRSFFRRHSHSSASPTTNAPLPIVRERFSMETATISSATTESFPLSSVVSFISEYTLDSDMNSDEESRPSTPTADRQATNASMGLETETAGRPTRPV